MEKYFFVGAVLVAFLGAVTDVRRARIPNWLTYTAVIVALISRAVLLHWSGLKSGALGILIGIVVATIVRNLFASVPAAVSLFWIITGVAMSVGVGLFFGSYPANRAANLDPIVCLRYE